MGRRKRRLEANRLRDEPMFDDDDLVECGGELIFAVDFTAAGFPIGLTLAELRKSSEREAGGAGWVRAKHILRDLLERELGAVRDVGWVKYIGAGRSRDVFAADVDLVDGCGGRFVVALPRDASPERDERTSREVRLVARLRGRALPFLLPDMVGTFPDGDRLALVQRFAGGDELELQPGPKASVRPWERVAAIAAAIHAIPGYELASVLPGSDSRKHHLRRALKVFRGLDQVEMREARAWARANLPPDEASTLVHGDLRSQNIRLGPDRPPYVGHWEYARRGDPAYDLAIVTRGDPRVFQIDRGLERLLDAYHQSSRVAVTAGQVHAHELCLMAESYRAALAGDQPRASVHELDRIRGLLRRLR
jgi:aminoglycoside phosphotransferase (APT) family kinase protein